MSDPATVYRDATFSRATRDLFAQFVDDLKRSCWFAEERQALEHVVARWDANEATEFIDALSEEGGVNESSSGVHGQQMSPLRMQYPDAESARTSPPAERASNEGGKSSPPEVH